MMYQEKLVTAIRVAGKILREDGDTVHLPFGCEYSLLIKNKNSVRALVRVEIDGTDVTEGVQLIVPANGSLDLERFIKEGNFDAGLKFKFIERTQKIEDGPRGIKAEDGLVRIEFTFERQPVAFKPNPYTYTKSFIPVHDIWMGSSIARGVSGISYGDLLGSTLCSTAGLKGASGVAGNAQPMNASYSAQSTMDWSDESGGGSLAREINDVGITVGGSISDQQFVAGAWFPTDGVKHVMVMKLAGKIGETKVEKPVTVKTKQECPTCGTMNKHGVKFCKECGTGLVVV